MNKLLAYSELPQDIAQQIGKVVSVWQNHLGGRLTGIYLHGSIALGAFDPNSGDIDILIVIEDTLTNEEKLDIAKEIITLDGHPRPLEMSAIRLKDAQNWHDGGNCIFHYSDFWTERYNKRLADGVSELYVVDNEFPDLDVTSYIRLIKQSGVVLYGRDIESTFSDIPDEDFFAAITADIDDYDFNSYNPRYFASNILILGRILSFKIEKRILSKYEAGLWSIDHMPEHLKFIPETAMKIWFGGEEHDLDVPELEEYRQFIIERINE